MNTIKEYLLFDPLSIKTYLKDNDDDKLKFPAIDIVSIGIILQNSMHLLEDRIDNNPQEQRELIGLILALVQILSFIVNKIFSVKLI